MPGGKSLPPPFEAEGEDGAALAVADLGTTLRARGDMIAGSAPERPEAMVRLLERTRTIGEGDKKIKVIIPLQSFEHVNGATLDYSERQGLIIRNPNKPPLVAIEGLVNDDELSASIEAIIGTDINPSLAAHGGFVTYVGHDDDGVAYLTMGGGCHGCSMSKMTMLEGVQTTLIEQVPGVTKVRDVTDHSTGANPFYS